MRQSCQPQSGNILHCPLAHFCFAVDNKNFFVLGGNQSDAVTVARIAKSRLFGARWPTTYPPRLQRLSTMKSGEFLTTTNEI